MHSDNDNDLEETKAEINSIKEEFREISKRIANLKGRALHTFYENSNEFRSILNEIKGKVLGQDEQDSLNGICSYVEKNPVKSALCCFASGVLLAIFLRK